jgi:cytochrome P450
MDVIRDLAAPLPSWVIADLLGVPQEDQPAFTRWSHDQVAVYDRPGTMHNRLEVMRRGQASMLEMKAYLEAVIEERRREPREDLITQLVQAEEAGDRLTTMEMVVMIVALLVGGNNSTAHLVGNAMLTLLRHPEVIDDLRAQPERARPTIEEVLRWESPVQSTSRVVRDAPIEIAGAEMQVGDSVHLLIGSANRDPAQFSDPDSFDPTRRPNRHLTFSHGAHFCLGSSTARAVAQTAVLSVIQRFDDLRLLTDEPRWQPGFSFRSVEVLPVAFSAER